MTQPIEPVPGGVRIRLHVQPRASHTELAGLHGDALKVRLASPPIEGAANLELVRFLAGVLEVPRSSVELVAGLAARRKTVLVRGVTVELARTKLGL
ncbi:MAG TPA: DUF167 domain-containing protein [Gemmatimonadales bacterium]|nr:DUF167 domain-containing protein [Gemmatimonadales bacterium]